MVRKLIFFPILAVLALSSGAVSAQNQQDRPTPAEARQTLDILQDPKKLAALVETLKTIAKASAPAAAKPADAKPSDIGLAPDSLGAQLLPQVTGWTGRIAGAAGATVAELSQAPLFWRALVHTASDPARRIAVADATWRILVVLLCAAVAEITTRWALRRPARSLEHRAPGPDDARNAWESLRRLPYAVVRLVLWLIPLGVFAALGNILAGAVGGRASTPLVTAAIVNAYAVGRGIVYGGRMLAAPKVARLRLVPLADAGAATIMTWLRRIVFVAVFGSAAAEILLLLGLRRTHDALIRLTALAVAILLGALAVRCRQPVAERIRGDVVEGQRLAEWRRWLAETWHYLALAAIVAAWLIAVGGVADRADTLDVLLGTIAVLVAARLLTIVALGAVARAMPHSPSTSLRYAWVGNRAARYYRVIRIVVVSVITACAAVALLQIWGADSLAWFAPGRLGRQLLSALITIGLAVAVAVIVWESVNAALERRLHRLGEREPMRSARLRTLLPILRTTLLITILIVVGATALSEIGVNIAPLLAGAGIVGIAVGFGAQTLVHDIITGMFILIENTIQVGDGVTVAGLSGTVEALSLRTLRLRASDGALHVIPFSAVVSVTNNNRGIGNAAVSVTIAPDQDIERASTTLAAIGQELRQDEKFAPMILGDLDLWGVDAVTAAGVTIAGKIPCTVAGHMPVQREFNRRMVERFAKAHIALA
ncbi:MAG TPA: mechanosensitive ion channel domain-containing protein [Stellaceae bacterium]|nr:mechanosensitive ion channel domain-containing protein [Stellaceae bacterium]